MMEALLWLYRNACGSFVEWQRENSAKNVEMASGIRQWTLISYLSMGPIEMTTNTPKRCQTASDQTADQELILLKVERPLYLRENFDFETSSSWQSCPDNHIDFKVGTKMNLQVEISK